MDVAATDGGREGAERVSAVPPLPGTRRFEGLRELESAAVHVAASVSPGAGLWLLAAALLTAVVRAPFPLCTVAVAAVGGFAIARAPWIRTAPAPHRATFILGVPFVLLGMVCAGLSSWSVEASPGLAPATFISALVAALLMALVGAFSVRALPPHVDALGRFCVAAQRYPWTATALIASLVAAEAWTFATGRSLAEVYLARAYLIVPIAPALATHLVWRARDSLGRMAPVAIGLPVVVAAFVLQAVVSIGLRNWSWSMAGIAVAATAPAVAWGLASSAMLARRTGSKRWPRAVAQIWIALAFLIVPAGMLTEASQLAPFLFAVAAPAYLIPAAAEFRGSAERRVAAGLLLGVAAAGSGLAVQMWGGGWDMTPRRLKQSWWPAEVCDDVGLGRVAYLAAHAQAGALLAALGVLVQRARWLTAVPLDHPIVTECPYFVASVSARTSAPGASSAGGERITSSPPASPSATSISPDAG